MWLLKQTHFILVKVIFPSWFAPHHVTSLNGRGAGSDVAFDLVNVARGGAWMALDVTLWIVTGSRDIILFGVALYGLSRGQGRE